MSACNKFREYLAKTDANDGDALQVFDELHQSNQENTGQNCTAKHESGDMLANVYIDIVKDGKKVTHDIHLCSVDDLKDTLEDLQVHSRFQAEIYVTDGIIKINVKG